MPYFIEFPGKTLGAPYSLSSEQYPVFLIPDISGDGLGLSRIKERLQNMRPQSTLFVGHDPSGSMVGDSIDDCAELIAQEILHLLRDTPGPVNIAGISYGSLLGEAIIQKLTEAGREVAFVAVDGPTMADSRTHFTPPNLTATWDFYRIFCYLAHVASFHSRKTMELPALSENTVSALSKMSVADQLSYLTRLFREASQDQTLRSLLVDTYIAGAVRRLTVLMKPRKQATPLFSQKTLPKIGLLQSEESQGKYSFSMAEGWKTVGTLQAIWTEPGSTHLSLMGADKGKSKDNSKVVAEKMAQFFKSCLSPMDEANMLFTAFAKKHPDVDLNELFRQFSLKRPEEKKESPASQERTPLSYSPPGQLSLPPSALSLPLSPGMEPMEGPAVMATDEHSPTLTPQLSPSSGGSDHPRTKPMPIQRRPPQVQSFPHSPQLSPPESPSSADSSMELHSASERDTRRPVKLSRKRIRTSPPSKHNSFPPSPDSEGSPQAMMLPRPASPPCEMGISPRKEPSVYLGQPTQVLYAVPRKRSMRVTRSQARGEDVGLDSGMPNHYMFNGGKKL